MVSLDEMIKGAWIFGEELSTPGPKFIEQLADLLVELHKSSYATTPFIMWNVVENLVSWDDSFCEDALYDLYAIKSELTGSVSLHGDLWRQNILVDQEGNLNGLRDWESLSVGDPHWDFRMIRRWIGWDGLDELLFMYNCGVEWNCKQKYIEILDKISICNSIRIRQERGLLRHDKSDALETFKKLKEDFKSPHLEL
jgi:thiamine kinase-like enzyme